MDLARVKPLYKDLRPFKDDFSGDKFSSELETYIAHIEKGLGIPVGIAAYGPDREQIKFRKSFF